MADERIAGQAVPRRDLLEKVTGAAVYTVDITPPGTLHAVVVRSSHAHATIVSIERDPALKLPGVVAVVTADDLAGLFPRFGHIVPDHFILASKKVRYYGEPVALVVADTVAAASDAAQLVEIRYEALPAVMTPDAALADGAQLVHEDDYGNSGDESFASLNAAGEDDTRDNCASESTLEWGDPDAAFASATTVVEDFTHYPMLYAYAMEPYNAVADFRDGRLHVITSAQHPFMVRNDLARVFSLPLARVRVEVPYVGGGYGSKSYTKVEPLAAVGSWATGRPVKLVLDVEGSIYTTRADSAQVRVRSAFDADGTILAREFDIVMNSGAYADNSPFVLEKAVNRCFGPYRVPNLRVRGRAIYTNTSPASSYRGFGAPQGSFAGELNLDHAAEELGIDPVAIRMRNLVDKGSEILPGKRGLDADLKADLAMVAESLRRDRHEQAGYGIGMACTASDAGAFPVSTAEVRIQTDGSAVVLSGSTEIGQGSRSALAQIAAEELGLELSHISVAQSDTGTGPYERTTGASRTTTLTGLALQRACADARAKIAAMAADLYGGDASDYTPCMGGVHRPDGTDVGHGAVIRGWFGANAGEVTGIGLVRREGATKAMPPFWEVGMVGVEVRVDPDTGLVEVSQLVTVADVGFAINPLAVEGQDLGAATQGLGGALYEELVYDGPQLLNPNIVEYRVPRMKDMPAKIDTMIAQRRDGIGPYGAKGAGEGALNPMAAAVAAAVARAVGRRPTEVPLTPERVWRLMTDRPPA
ncbi:MAG TPA: xanthine dehydrogenase family protein molybdopterin-binding subunit [Jatrophihabitans sp.]|nr:xanthine dehydrogenase family protein molybdopterin-binding subunit [Jatrophihabitans sp.]